MKEKLNVGDLEKLLISNNPIYTSKKGYHFCFIEIKNEKLFFSIPNHKKGGYYRKSISISHLDDSLNKTNDDFKNLPFEDCRKSFLKAVSSIILKS